MLSKNRIKEIQLLHLKKHRDATNLFLVEGLKTVNELIVYKPTSITQLYYTSAFNPNTLPNEVVEKSVLVSEEELLKISLQKTPNQVLAVCRYFNPSSLTFNFSKHFSLYLDDIRDPGNFGTIIRLANWYGIAKLFASPQSCEFYNPKVIQSTMGAFLRVSVVYCELDELIRENTVNLVYGAVLNGTPIYTSPLSNGLIVIGNEANGIKESNLNFLTHPITIPSASKGDMESLNSAMASSIIVSEFFRQSLTNAPKSL